MGHINKETFPFKLHYTIEWASNSEFSSALMWSPSGNAFVVRDRDVMVEHIIPKFFDHKKWRSFTRQLNLWGFKRELRGPDTEGEFYYHQYFHRGKLEELQLIKRTEVKRPSRSIKNQLSDSYDKSHALSSSRQSSTVTANHDGFSIQVAIPHQTDDTMQGASFLAGLKGSPEKLVRANSAAGGGLPTAANYFNNMQCPSQMSSDVISFKTSSLPTTMQTQMMQSQMMQSQMMQSQMIHSQRLYSQQQMMMQRQMMMQPQSPASMIQHQMFQGYRTGNWNPSREMLSQMSTQQLAVMASNMNRMNNSTYNNDNMNVSGFNILHPSQAATLRSVSGSGLGGPGYFRRISSGLSSLATNPRLDSFGYGEDKTDEDGRGDFPSQPLPPAA